MAGAVSWVIVRLFVPPVPPGRNSLTVPSTSERVADAVTVGAVRVKTKMPSEVDALRSAAGSWK